MEGGKTMRKKRWKEGGNKGGGERKTELERRGEKKGGTETDADE